MPQQFADVLPVDDAVRGNLRAASAAKVGSRSMVAAICGGGAGGNVPAARMWAAQSALVVVPCRRGREAPRAFSCWVSQGPVVGGEQHQRVLVDPAFPDRLEHLADAPVNLLNGIPHRAWRSCRETRSERATDVDHRVREEEERRSCVPG